MQSSGSHDIPTYFETISVLFRRHAGIDNSRITSSVIAGAPMKSLPTCPCRVTAGPDPDQLWRRQSSERPRPFDIPVHSVPSLPARLSTPAAPRAFSISVNGNPTPNIVWQRSNDKGATWIAIDGATSTTYNFTVQPADNRRTIFAPPPRKPIHRAAFSAPAATLIEVPRRIPPAEEST